MDNGIKQLASQLKAELTGNILPFWMTRMTDPSGGFYGRMDGNGSIVAGAEKGAILNSRILWTFSSAYRMLKAPEYLETARRAYLYLKEHFVDSEFGGVYWSVDSAGRPLDTKKQFYALAFAQYGLVEYYRATGENEALEEAIRIFELLEEHSFDPVRGGYIEAATRDWQPIADMRLSEKDRNDAKTMNTHLHILESYTALYRVWKHPRLHDSLSSLIDVFRDRIIRPDSHMGLFFDEDWNLTCDGVSYGHDIEASWLLWEAAEVLGERQDEIEEMSKAMAEAAMQGMTESEGLFYESEPSGTNEYREWWVQAETVVGCLNMYELTGLELWLDRAISTWNFIRERLVCPDGEWYWGLSPVGNALVADTAKDRAGFWKCPYHNGRMCMEAIRRA